VIRFRRRRFDPNEADEARTILALAAGDIDEKTLARWIARYTRSA